MVFGFIFIALFFFFYVPVCRLSRTRLFYFRAADERLENYLRYKTVPTIASPTRCTGTGVRQRTKPTSKRQKPYANRPPSGNNGINILIIYIYIYTYVQYSVVTRGECPTVVRVVHVDNFRGQMLTFVK